jgi:hypothetical protein
MKVIVKKVILVVFAAGICSVMSAQSIRWAENGVEFCRKLSDNKYVSINSDGSLSMAVYEIKNNKFWLNIGEYSEYKGYCTQSKDEYVYYDRYDNIVASYVPSQGRYYSHSSQGKEIFESFSTAILSNGKIIFGDETQTRYTADKDFDPVAIGFILFVW